MAIKILTKKPLVEAIFELRWKLQKPTPDIRLDPHYKLLIGRLYNKFEEDYPYHEQLPTATMPDEIAGYVVQHRFRSEKDGWPLIQIGPGVITVNDTEGYIWEDFNKKIKKAVSSLYEVYPESDKNLIINRLLLRYIDAIPFDFDKNDITKFLKKKLKTEINIYNRLFDNTQVQGLPLSLDLRFSFISNKPKGAVHLRFVKGKRKGSSALIWETMVESVDDNVPKIKNDIFKWVSNAHDLTDDWFFKLIEGDLVKEFE